MASLLWAQEYRALALVALRDAAIFTRLKGTTFWDFPFSGENQSGTGPKDQQGMCPRVWRALKEIAM